MLRIIIVAVIAIAIIYSIVDIITARANTVRLIPKWLWLVAALVLPLIGTIAWFIFGRPNAHSIASSQRTYQAPDDDEDFLRNLR